jgi:hypothetical protein
MLSLFTRKTNQRQVEVANASELTRITEANVNLTYWSRPVQEDINLIAQHLIQVDAPPLVENLTQQTAEQRLKEYFAKIAFSSFTKQLFIGDILMLVQPALMVSQGHSVKVWLKVVVDDECSKFHTDRYDYRLLCTYVGAGTEWIKDAYVNRLQLTKGQNEDIIKDPAQIQRLNAFDVAMLKGEASLENQGKGIVHRSPSITHRGEKRLVLRVDC